MNRTFTIASHAVIPAGEPPDVGFVPAIQRRRLSPLQKLYFALAERLEGAKTLPAVFASRDGEDTLTRRIVDDFQSDGSVSPNRFSSSVYNAAPGLWSVFAANRSPYTAVAGGEDTVEVGLMEALLPGGGAFFVYAEETGGGYAAAAVFAPDGAEGVRVTMTDGDRARGPVGWDDLCRFLSGEADALRGRYLTLCRA